jgi:formylglycine-generating enzyme required for sulfatase activity
MKTDKSIRLSLAATRTCCRIRANNHLETNQTPPVHRSSDTRTGPEIPFDPAEPTEKKRVQKGGSFLCTDQYCTRYMVGTRGKGEVNTGNNHVGFRCALAP